MTYLPEPRLQPQRNDPAYEIDTLDGYQQGALATAAGALDGGQIGLAIAALGLTGEAGEVADYLKKVIGHGHPLDAAKVAKELGDVLWYVAILASIIDYPLSDIARLNREKLAARYPQGFTRERSINRGNE